MQCFVATDVFRSRLDGKQLGLVKTQSARRFRTKADQQLGLAAVRFAPIPLKKSLLDCCQSSVVIH
jgi:hypothetical protein